MDGSKALRAAILQYAGEAAFLQRCQPHKIRNVAEYLPEAERSHVKFRMRAAYAKPEAVDARNALYRLHEELVTVNPSAAASLAEGLEETLTLQELGLRGKLRQCFSSTNIIGCAAIARSPISSVPSRALSNSARAKTNEPPRPK